MPSRFYQHALVATTKFACSAQFSSALRMALGRPRRRRPGAWPLRPLADTGPNVSERTRRSARSPMDGLLRAGQVPDLPVVDINLGPGLGGLDLAAIGQRQRCRPRLSRAPRELPAQPFAPATVAEAVLGAAGTAKVGQGAPRALRSYSCPFHFPSFFLRASSRGHSTSLRSHPMAWDRPGGLTAQEATHGRGATHQKSGPRRAVGAAGRRRAAETRRHRASAGQGRARRRRCGRQRRSGALRGGGRPCRAAPGSAGDRHRPRPRRYGRARAGRRSAAPLAGPGRGLRHRPPVQAPRARAPRARPLPAQAGHAGGCRARGARAGGPPGRRPIDGRHGHGPCSGRLRSRSAPRSPACR